MTVNMLKHPLCKLYQQLPVVVCLCYRCKYRRRQIWAFCQIHKKGQVVYGAMSVMIEACYNTRSNGKFCEISGKSAEVRRTPPSPFIIYLFAVQNESSSFSILRCRQNSGWLYAHKVRIYQFYDFQISLPPFENWSPMYFVLRSINCISVKLISSMRIYCWVLILMYDSGKNCGISLD